ncbi:hypothetical protein MRS44_018229 [Fusarium solani]|uniref:uncharacterized protein n=1 Tax=Fusarium solani TaxID=169388 RepID=UPI0032C44738|nr:hypothetical protein MRS44_018229 [Fusarium solani]
MGQGMSFRREWTIRERIFLIIGEFSRPGRLSRQLLDHASLAQDLQVNNDKQVRVETLRLATLQNVDSATRKLTWVLQPSSWFLCPWGLYAFGTYPIQPGLNTIEAAIKICAVANSTSISSQDLMILNLLLDSEIDTTFWMEEGKTLEIPGRELLTIAGATGTWFGFGQKPHPGQTLARYLEKEGYFCGRIVKEEHVEESSTSPPPTSNSLKTERREARPLARRRGNGKIQKAHVKESRDIRKRANFRPRGRGGLF